MKPGMYIMAPEPISTAYLIDPSLQSVCLHVYLLSLQGNGSVNTFLPRRIHTTIELLMRSVSYQREVGE
jgi:hypothetical protein